MVQARRSGRSVVFFSLKAGAGTSTLATNVALLLAQQRGAPVALLDLALEQGNTEVLLDLMPQVDLGTMARNAVDPTALGPDQVRSLVTPHPAGVALLAAPRQPEDAERVTPELTAAALRALAGAYGCVVVDTPSAFTEHALGALEIADLVVMVTTPDLAGAKASSAALRVFRQLRLPEERVALVLNAPHGEGGIDREQFEQAVGVMAVAVVPYDPSFGQALNTGQPHVLRQERRPRASQAALADLARRVGERVGA